MPDLAKEVTEYLAGERRPFHFDKGTLAYMIMVDAQSNPMWTKRAIPEWERAIDEAIKIGLIESRNGKLGVVSKMEEAKPQQMGLFE